MRSRSAVGILSGAGFAEVHSLEGGINAWNGLVADGPPEAGTAVFSEADTTEDLVLLARILEQGSQNFYQRLSDLVSDQGTRDLFLELARAEARHQEALLRAYGEISSGPPVSERFAPDEKRDLMEGGVTVSACLAWARGKEVPDLLQFSMALETNALDLYLKMIPRVAEPASRRVLETLTREETAHIERIGELLEKRV